MGNNAHFLQKTNYGGMRNWLRTEGEFSSHKGLLANCGLLQLVVVKKIAFLSDFCIAVK